MTNFFLGVLFAIFITPVLDSFTGVIITFFEVIKSKMAISITKSQQKIQSMDKEQPEHYFKCGFEPPKEEEV